MPDNIPQIFRKNPENLVVYDWENLLENTGYVSYDGYVTCDSGGVAYSLVPTALATYLKSATGFNQETTYTLTVSSNGTGQADWTKDLDVDFDLSEYKRPQVIEGKGYVRLSFYLYGNNSGSLGKIIVRLRKWNGTTETEIVSVESVNDYDYGYHHIVPLEFDVPATSFAVGDQLRLTVEGWLKDAGATTSILLYIAGDPSNEVSETVVATSAHIPAGQTRIILHVPYRMIQ